MGAREIFTRGATVDSPPGRNQLGTHIFSGGAKIFEVESRPQVTGLLATSAVFTAKVTV